MWHMDYKGNGGVGVYESNYSNIPPTACLTFLLGWGVHAEGDIGCPKLRQHTLEVSANKSHMCWLMLHIRSMIGKEWKDG